MEFALVFPVLCALLFGMIDGGRYISTRAMLSQAAAVGARTACLYSTNGPSAIDAAIAGAAPMLTGANTQAIDCVGGGCGAWPLSAGDSVVVTVQYNFVAVFYKNLQKTMTQKSRMVCE
jgi:Flp pilus assembly protein TadG